MAGQVGVVDRFADRDMAAVRALAPALAGLLAGARRAEEVVRLQGRMRASFSTLQTVPPCRRPGRLRLRVAGGRYRH